MNNRFNDMCDVPWWESLKTIEEKDNYCNVHFHLTYAEYLKIINSDLPIKEAYEKTFSKHSV